MRVAKEKENAKVCGGTKSPRPPLFVRIPMIVIGLTGGMAMGKTTAASMLARRGVAVCDTDREVRRLLSPGGKAVGAVCTAFAGDGVGRNAEGGVDRVMLRRIVFADPEKRKILQSLLHPMVKDAIRRFLKHMALRRARLVALDVPLLFESGLDRLCHVTVAVTAPSFVQRRRIRARGWGEAEAQGALSAQLQDTARLRLADVVAPAGLGVRETLRHLVRLLHRLRGRRIRHA